MINPAEFDGGIRASKMRAAQAENMANDFDGITAEYRARVAAANINEETLLATDYLNHFNEIIMLIGMIPDMPE